MSTQSIHLNKSSRQRLREKILQHRFAKDQLAMQQAWEKFGQTIYNDVYPPQVQKLMAQLPRSFLPSRNILGVKFGVDGYNYDYVTLGEARSCSYEHCHGCAKSYPEGSEICQKYFELKTTREELKSQMDTARREIDSVLESVATTRALVGIWPEIESFIEGPRASGGAKLPVAMGQLNEKLGLPPEEATQRGET